MGQQPTNYAPREIKSKCSSPCSKLVETLALFLLIWRCPKTTTCTEQYRNRIALYQVNMHTVVKRCVKVTDPLRLNTPLDSALVDDGAGQADCDAMSGTGNLSSCAFVLRSLVLIQTLLSGGEVGSGPPRPRVRRVAHLLRTHSAHHSRNFRSVRSPTKCSVQATPAPTRCSAQAPADHGLEVASVLIG